MPCDYSPYELPTLEFVGGETQDLAFHIYFYKNKQPFGLNGCTASISVVGFTNRGGTPVLTKEMKTAFNDDVTVENVLTVTLLPEETVDLNGKYIYQISIRDIGGDVEIPKHGIMFVTNNIDKGFIKK